jgi:hypothetical protein
VHPTVSESSRNMWMETLLPSFSLFIASQYIHCTMCIRQLWNLGFLGFPRLNFFSCKIWSWISMCVHHHHHYHHHHKTILTLGGDIPDWTLFSPLHNWRWIWHEKEGMKNLWQLVSVQETWRMFKIWPIFRAQLNMNSEVKKNAWKCTALG